MGFEPIADAFDLNHNGMMQQPIEQRSGHDRVAEHFGPFPEGAIRCQYHGVFFIACADQLGIQIGLIFRKRQISYLIDNQHCRTTQLAQFVGQLTVAVHFLANVSTRSVSLAR